MSISLRGHSLFLAFFLPLSLVLLQMLLGQGMPQQYDASALLNEQARLQLAAAQAQATGKQCETTLNLSPPINRYPLSLINQ